MHVQSEAVPLIMFHGMLLYYCSNYFLHAHHFHFASRHALQMQPVNIYYKLHPNAEVAINISSCCLSAQPSEKVQ